MIVFSRQYTMLYGAVMLGCCLLSVVAGCSFGPLTIPVADILQILAAKVGVAEPHPDAAWTLVVGDIRLSRTILSLLCGMALALSGATFQGLLRNPLADPFTLGVSSGAAFGAALAIYLGVGSLMIIPGLEALPLAALGGAWFALLAVLTLGRVNGVLRRDTLVLAGIVTATFLSALISLVKALDEESVASIVFWIMGSFQGRGWNHVLLFLPYFIPGGLVLLFSARELDLLSLGEKQATLLGMNASRSRLILLLAASLLAGAAVAVAGVIGFVGLVVPHLVRMRTGAQHRSLLPLCALLGGILLLWSDVLARSILPDGMELPVGVVTSLIGGPFFCFLLTRKQGATA